MQDAEDKLESARQTELNQKSEIDNDEAQMEQLKSTRNSKKMDVDQKDEEIGKCRREVGAIAKDIQAAQKQLNTIETKIEQRKADRHAILMQCKVTYLPQLYSFFFRRLHRDVSSYRWKISLFLCFTEIWRT